MSGAVREPTQADFDLERFIDMFDEALTSQDPRVINALRSLMMIAALTKPESQSSGLHNRNAGPLRRLYEDLHDLNRRIYQLEDEVRRVRNHITRQEYSWEEKNRYTMQATAEMARAVDHNVLNQLKQQHYQASKVISGGMTLGPENAKGKLFK